MNCFGAASKDYSSEAGEFFRKIINLFHKESALLCEL